MKEKNSNKDSTSKKSEKNYKPPRVLFHGTLQDLTAGGDPSSTNDMDGTSTGMLSGGSSGGGSTMTMN